MSIKHNGEQMEATRADFEKVWAKTILPRVKLFGAKTDNEVWFCYEAAWVAFKAGQQTTKQNTP